MRVITGVFYFCTMARRLLLFCCLAYPLFAFPAGKPYVFNKELVEAYGHVMALRFEKGMTLLDAEKAKTPDSPALAFVSDYLYFIRSFINEDVKAFETEIVDFEKRLAVLKKGDNASPYYHYCQAELLVHQAALRFKFRDYTKGAANVRDAYVLLEKNIKLYPNFQPHYKSMGMLEVLVGTIPPKFSWVSSMLGMTGNIPAGMKKIEDFMNAPFVNAETEMLKEEALFLYGFLQLHIVKEKEEAWKLVEKATKNYRQSLLQTYVRASVGMHCKKTEEVIRTLETRPVSNDYARFYFLEYMLGTAKLHKQDSTAGIHFKVFVTYFKGENYIKDAYRKLAWHSLCHKEEHKYTIYMDLVKSKGRDQVDEDKEALNEAVSGMRPHIGLLRARLLFDGGYLDKALDIMTRHASENWTRPRDRGEYMYRLARIYDEKKDVSKALQLYQQTIDLCRNETWYFAANSSLHMGYIYEKRKEYVKARACFEQVMKYPNTEYKTSLDQKAKAALERIKGK